MSSLEFNIDSEFWKVWEFLEKWKNLLQDVSNCFILKKLGGNFSVNILLTDDESIQDLNKRFRGKDSPTNVLSFPQYDKIDAISYDDEIFIGDIAMSYEKIMRESLEFNIKFFDRCTHLFVHGVLHLLGMDHMNEIEQDEMENLEIKILEEFGIENPYILGEEKKV